MVTIVVECPRCHKIKKLHYKPKYFFHCCGISHEVAKHKLSETDFNSLKKGAEMPKNGQKNRSEDVEIEVEEP